MTDFNWYDNFFAVSIENVEKTSTTETHKADCILNGSPDLISACLVDKMKKNTLVASLILHASQTFLRDALVQPPIINENN